MTEPDSWTTREVADYLRLFERDPRTREPDPSRPDPHKVHAFAHRNPDFPKPRKFGRHNRYIRAEVRAWWEAQGRGGPTSIPTAPNEPAAVAQKRRGPKPKAVGGAA